MPPAAGDAAGDAAGLAGAAVAAGLAVGVGAAPPPQAVRMTEPTNPAATANRLICVGEFKCCLPGARLVKMPGNALNIRAMLTHSLD